MAKYSIEDIPNDTWGEFTSRAKREGWPLHAAIQQLMDDYGHGRVDIGPAPPPALQAFAWLRPHFRRHAINKAFLSGTPDQQWEVLALSVDAYQPTHHTNFARITLEQKADILRWLNATARDRADAANRLTLRAIAFSGSGLDLQTDRRAFHYEVIGLEPGHQAWVADFGRENDWRVLEDKGGQQTPWRGSYPTARAALEAIAAGTVPPDETKD